MCKMWMSCAITVRAAERVTNEMLAGTWRETEYRLDVSRVTNGDYTETCWAHKKLCEVQGLKMYRFLQYTLWSKIDNILFHRHLRPDTCTVMRATLGTTGHPGWWYCEATRPASEVPCLRESFSQGQRVSIEMFQFSCPTEDYSSKTGWPLPWQWKCQWHPRAAWFFKQCILKWLLNRMWGCGVNSTGSG
jgi:hypothetical protein